MKTSKVLLVVALVAVVGMAFRVSWNALRDVATAVGADHTAAILYPIVVDGLMALALVAALVLPEPNRRFALRVLAGYTLASLALNYVHGMVPALHGVDGMVPLAAWAPAHWVLVLLATSLPVGSIFFGSDLVAKVLHHKPAEVTTDRADFLYDIQEVAPLERADVDQPAASFDAPVEPLEVVTPPVIELPAASPVWDDFTTSKVTTVPWFEDHTRAPLEFDDERQRWASVDDKPVAAAVPAETDRQVVTEPVGLTPNELRQRARRLHRKLVKSGGRGVTIDLLREEFGLSRREATDLRRDVLLAEMMTGGRS